MTIDTIYRHEARPEWGNAIIAWQRGPKRGYQFEDGKLRVFKRGWFDQLEEVDLPAPRAAATAARLQRKLGLTPRRVAASSYDGISFADQLRLFEHFYEGGFRGDVWTRDKRSGGDKTLKRHRDASIARAADVLSAPRLDARIAADAFDDAWRGILAVLDATDLVTRAQLAPLSDIGDDVRRDLVLRTRGLLWGDEAYEVRFERYVAALALATNKQPTWLLATPLSALIHPHDHASIRPSAVRAQASWMAPRLRWTNTPSAQLYVRVLRMIQNVRSELVDAGHQPRDLLDVTDFMWTTLRPKTRKLLPDLDSDAQATEAA